MWSRHLHATWPGTVRDALQNDYGIVVHPDVRKALRDRQAVVALESTIISHGMPYPQNLRTALEVEDIVRQGVPTRWDAPCAWQRQ